ncbi:MAG: hypothetical protein LUG16_03335 [Candidatus Gastranaerophilales bacterium]|nr:hypothetical protein [Candidatus Gastranaerophilales bacterium]
MTNLNTGDMSLNRVNTDLYPRGGENERTQTEDSQISSIFAPQGDININGGNINIYTTLPYEIDKQPSIFAPETGENEGSGKGEEVDNEDGTYDYSPDIDANGDGIITEEEAKGFEVPEDVSGDIDTDGDGKISHEEIEAYQLRQKIRDFIENSEIGIFPEDTMNSNQEGTTANDGQINSSKGLDDETAKGFAKEIYEATAGQWGTDENTVDSILKNEDLEPAQLLSVMQAYSDEYGSMVKDIAGDYSGEEEQELMDIIADSLVSEAQNGNSDAVEMICQELYNSTAGSFMNTKDSFVNAIFEKLSEDSDTLAEVAKTYSNVNGSDLVKDLENDGIKDYTKLINSALLKASK